MEYFFQIFAGIHLAVPVFLQHNYGIPPEWGETSATKESRDWGQHTSHCCDLNYEIKRKYGCLTERNEERDTSIHHGTSSEYTERNHRAESQLFPTAPGLGEMAKPGNSRPQPQVVKLGNACPSAQSAGGWVPEPDSPLWPSPAEETPRPGSTWREGKMS